MDRLEKLEALSNLSKQELIELLASSHINARLIKNRIQESITINTSPVNYEIWSDIVLGNTQAIYFYSLDVRYLGYGTGKLEYANGMVDWENQLVHINLKKSFFNEVQGLERELKWKLDHHFSNEEIHKFDFVLYCELTSQGVGDYMPKQDK